MDPLKLLKVINAIAGAFLASAGALMTAAGTLPGAGHIITVAVAVVGIVQLLSLVVLQGIGNQMAAYQQMAMRRK